MSPGHEAALEALARSLAARGRAATTVYQFGRTARIFLERTAKPVAEIATEDVRAFLAADAERGNSLVSRRALLVHLRALFRALVEAKLIERDPTERLAIERPAKKAQVFLSEDGLAKLLSAALEADPSPHLGPGVGRAVALRTRALLELLYATTMRASEAGRVLVADLDLAGASVVVRAAKRGESRTLPLPSAALPHLHAYLREGRPRLVRPDGRDRGRFLLSRFGRPLNANQLGLVVRTLGKRAGVKVSPHVFRRSSATDMARAGINLECVRQVLGHTRLSTTSIYVDVRRDDMRRAVERLPTSG